MAPDVETQLIRKVDEIHTYIVGVMGQPGAADVLKDHGKRISRLEKWGLIVFGGGSVLLFIVKLMAGH